MATGDATDMRARLRSVLPPRFSDSNPILEGLIAGAAAILVSAYSLYAYAVEQARIATTTGIWLDLIAQDFFGVGLLRLINETDDAYRSRILASLFRPQATRSAISNVVEGLTGEKPTIIEPFSPADCGPMASVMRAMASAAPTVRCSRLPGVHRDEAPRRSWCHQCRGLWQGPVGLWRWQWAIHVHCQYHLRPNDLCCDCPRQGGRRANLGGIQ
jgi:hypothetical protein